MFHNLVSDVAKTTTSYDWLDVHIYFPSYCILIKEQSDISDQFTVLSQVSSSGTGTALISPQFPV